MEGVAASEGLWRRVFENSAVGIALTDLEGHFDITNSAYQELVGYTDEELRNLSFLDITVQEFQEQNWALIRDLLERRSQQFNIEKQYRRKDGSQVWVRNNVSLVPGADGAPRYIMAIVEDISERKRAEEALRDSEEETRLIVETAPDAAITMDAKGLVRRWNAAAEHIFGWAASEAINRRVSELIIPRQYREAYQRGLEKFHATGEGVFLGKAIEVTALRRDGQEFPVELSVAPAKLGGVWVFNAFIRDLTEPKRAESALQEAQAELAHVTRLTTMGEFAASIAHEVSQPLTAIAANGDACVRWLNAEPADLNQARESAKKIVRDANRAGEVIKGVRELAKKSALQLAPLSMNELIAEVIVLARGEIQRNRAVLRTELTPHLPFVLGDRVQLAQVLLNLLLNAMEAMRDVAPGQRSLVVGSEIGEPDGAVVYVRDCGAGISTEVIQNIFKPFFSTKPGGTGVGLSISRSIVEAHHGRLWTTPNEECGMTFSFSLPAVKR
jgi:PAS domain S-box-containing protein